MSEWIKCSERMPEPGVTVLVYTPPKTDYPYDDVQFDFIDPDSDDPTWWFIHGEHYEHYCCVAKPEGSTGPSERAAYTHWAAIPNAPEAP